MFVRMLMNVCLCPWVCIDSSIRIDEKVEARRCRHFIPLPFLPMDSHGVHVDAPAPAPAPAPPPTWDQYVREFARLYEKSICAMRSCDGDHDTTSAPCPCEVVYELVTSRHLYVCQVAEVRVSLLRPPSSDLFGYRGHPFPSDVQFGKVQGSEVGP